MPADPRPLPAGDFSSWITEMMGSIRGERSSDVPCAGCTACCTSSQFVHIGPDETDTLAHIPAELLFPAPRRPSGHVVIGYDERGHCPMLIAGRCSIYEHRPRTCRTYDCRIFAATGVEPEGDGKAEIASRTRRWQFGFPRPGDGARSEAVRAAAAYLAEQPELLGAGATAPTATQLAVAAIEIHDLFLHDGEADDAVVVDRSLDAVRLRLTPDRY